MDGENSLTPIELKNIAILLKQKDLKADILVPINGSGR